MQLGGCVRKLGRRGLSQAQWAQLGRRVRQAGVGAVFVYGSVLPVSCGASICGLPPTCKLGSRIVKILRQQQRMVFAGVYAFIDGVPYSFVRSNGAGGSVEEHSTRQRD